MLKDPKKRNIEKEMINRRPHWFHDSTKELKKRKPHWFHDPIKELKERHPHWFDNIEAGNN